MSSSSTSDLAINFRNHEGDMAVAVARGAIQVGRFTAMVA
jgi:hypothetical protein